MSDPGNISRNGLHFYHTADLPTERETQHIRKLYAAIIRSAMVAAGIAEPEHSNGEVPTDPVIVAEAREWIVSRESEAVVMLYLESAGMSGEGGMPTARAALEEMRRKVEERVRQEERLREGAA